MKIHFGLKITIFLLCGSSLIAKPLPRKNGFVLNLENQQIEEKSFTGLTLDWKNSFQWSNNVSSTIHLYLPLLLNKNYSFLFYGSEVLNAKTLKTGKDKIIEPSRKMYILQYLKQLDIKSKNFLIFAGSNETEKKISQCNNQVLECGINLVQKAYPLSNFRIFLANNDFIFQASNLERNPAFSILQNRFSVLDSFSFYTYTKVQFIDITSYDLQFGINTNLDLIKKQHSILGIETRQQLQYLFNHINFSSNNMLYYRPISSYKIATGYVVKNNSGVATYSLSMASDFLLLSNIANNSTIDNGVLVVNSISTAIIKTEVQARYFFTTKEIELEVTSKLNFDKFNLGFSYSMLKFKSISEMQTAYNKNTFLGLNFQWHIVPQKSSMTFQSSISSDYQSMFFTRMSASYKFD